MRAVASAVGTAEAAVGLLHPAARRQAASLRGTGHRGWPAPARPWAMAQTWERLLFAHWSVPVDALRAVVPPQLPLDLVDDRAFVGITPFAVRGFRLRGTLPPPVLSSFPELNVRTYVTVGGRPGIFFFSLDAGSAAAVLAARRSYRLPYFRADMAVGRDGASVAYRSRRTSADGPPAAFTARYRPIGPASLAGPGSLEHFLTERYCLYTLDASGRVLRGTIHHAPWSLQDAEADIGENTMTAALGLPLEGEPLLHYAHRQDVVFWTLEPADAG